MFLAARRPRRELYGKWQDIHQEIIEEISTAESANARLLCMHLTWYHPETREFFAPVDLRYLQEQRCPIIHIVILIDDIYDMYRRLSEPLNLYDQDAHQVLRDGFAKLSDDDSKIDLINTDLESLLDDQRIREREYRVQGIELAISELIAWRRAEMIQAENIARTLECDLTVFGIKHSRQSLEYLVSHPQAPRIYLSHRITEPRIANKASRKHTQDTGEWAPVADEVNTLHQLFVENHQILINPTAIDELRFDNLPSGGGRSPILAPRWPLPTGDILFGTPSDTDYQHFGLLTGDLPPDNLVSSSIARALSNRIYVEIPFRDHVIVENTPNLCVFRPFYCTDPGEASTRATWSGGVGPEIEHWRRYSSELGQTPESGSTNLAPQDRQTANTQRRIAFISSIDEIEGRIKYLTHIAEGTKGKGRIEFEETIIGHIDDFLMEWGNSMVGTHEASDRHDYDRTRRALIGDRSASTQLRSGPIPEFMQYYPRLLLSTVHFSFFAALYHAFSTMERPRRTLSADASSDMDTLSAWIQAVASSSSDVGFFLVEESSKRRIVNLDELATRLSKFFADPVESSFLNHIDETDNQATELENERFWRTCVKRFQEETGDSVGAFAAGTVGAKYRQLCQMLNSQPLTL